MSQFIKVPEVSWESIFRTCKEHGITCIELLIVTKYPVNSEHIIGFSELVQTNVNLALVLYHYNYQKMTLTENNCPSMISDDDWEWMLPYLQQNNLLNHEILVFWRGADDTSITEICYKTSDNYHYKQAKIYAYTNYIIRMWYQVNDIACPEELEQLLDTDLVKGIYLRKL